MCKTIKLSSYLTQCTLQRAEFCDSPPINGGLSVVWVCSVAYMHYPSSRNPFGDPLLHAETYAVPVVACVQWGLEFNAHTKKSTAKSSRWINAS